jgi:pyruvate,water dikinase
MTSNATPKYVRWFAELGLGDVPAVGGKNASLGELYRALTAEGVLVPNGFATTAEAYRDALAAAGAWDRLHAILDPLDPSNVAATSPNARGRRATSSTAPTSPLSCGRRS